MKIIKEDALRQINGAEQLKTHDGSNIVKYDNGYMYGTILLPASQNGQILDVSILVREDTLFSALNPF